MAMTRDQAHKALDSVSSALSSQHADQADRLYQLTNHIETAHMAVDHLFDHADNAAAEQEG